MSNRKPVQSKRRAATSPAIARAPVKKSYRKNYRNKRYSKVQRRAMLSNNRLTIAPCTAHYFKALHDPFTTPSGVCIPDGQFPLPSQKAYATVKGQFQLGIGGYGFITLAPSSVNDRAPVAYTTNTSVGGNAALFNTYTNTGSSMFSNLPYVFADVETNKDISARIVASGIRVRYAGAEQTRSGIIVGFEDQDHLNTFTRESFNTTLARTSSASRRPSGDGNWDMTVCYSGPTAPNMVDFVNSAYPVKPIAGGADVTPIVIAIQGNAGDSYEFEAAVHVEYIGRKASGKTPTHSDNMGYNYTLQAVKSTAAQKPLQPADEGVDWSKYWRYAKEAVSIAGGVASIAGMILG